MDITLIRCSGKGTDYLLSKRFIQQIESLGSKVSEMVTVDSDVEIVQACADSYSKNRMAFVLGDAREVTCTSIKAASGKYDNLGVIMFDADSKSSTTFDGVLKPENIVYANTRPVERVSAKILKTIASQEIANLHLSLNLNVLDPEVAPGASESFPGGLAAEDLYRILRIVMATGMVRSIDLVGYDPDKDRNDITVAAVMSAIYGIFG